MARLFTTTPPENKDESLEIEIDVSGKELKSSTLAAGKRNTKITNQDKENLKLDNKSSQMTTINTKLGTGIKKQKLVNGSWLKLLSLPSQELVSELKAIHEYLSPIDQDQVEDRTELIGLADQLAAPGLIRHKDRAVRVLVACSIANILRLFAPDAPYSIEQFEMIFNLFIHQLKGIAEPDGIYYNYHYFLLESLSTVKSIVLIFDLPQADILQREIFQMALDMMHPSLLKNVRLYLLELVQTLLEECDQVSVELVSDLLIPHLATNSNNELCRVFVQDLVRQSAEKLQAPLAIYFSEQLGRIARAQDTEAVLIRLGKEAHEYAVNVARVCLPAASSIISLLEEELKVEAQDIRLQSIQALSQIFILHLHRLPSLSGIWNNWLNRKNDKSSRCRSAWIRGALQIFHAAAKSHNLSICDQLLPYVIERIEDPDEKVRLITIQSIATEFLPIVQSIPSTLNLIETLTDRCLDRKEEVQSTALSLCSDLLFSLLKSNNNSLSSNDDLELLIKRLMQLVFTESRIHRTAFMGYIEREIFVRMAREFPDSSIRAQKLVRFLNVTFSDDLSHKAFCCFIRQKNQFLKAWTAFLKLSRLPDASLSDIHRAKSIQLTQFLSEIMPGVPEIETQRSLLSVPTLKNSHSDVLLLQMLIDLAEGRVNESSEAGAFNLISRIESHLKASTSLSLSLKKVIKAALPFGSQISLNTALIGQLTLIPEASLILQDLLTEFPQLFENRTVELIGSVLHSKRTGSALNSSSVVALSQYLSNQNSSFKSCDPSLLNELDPILLGLLHPPLGTEDTEEFSSSKFDPKAIGTSAQIIVNLHRQSPAELIQDLILQLAQDEKVQIKSALAALTGLVKTSNITFKTCPLLVPHFEMIFELISQRLFSTIPLATLERNNKKSKIPVGEDLMFGWPRVCDLLSDFQIPVLCVRFLASFVYILIRQHTRKQSNQNHQNNNNPDQNEQLFRVDLDTISSIRSFSVGFFLAQLKSLEEIPVTVSGSRLKYSLLKGLMTCLPDASASDLTTHLQPLFLALQDTDQRLRYKLSTLLCKLIRSRRLSDAFLPLLFFAGAHESSLLIKSALKSQLHEIIRSWPVDSKIIEELLPVLIVYTVRHPDYSKDFSSSRDLIKGYYEHFVENVVDSNNCGAIYEAVSRLKLYHFVPIDPVLSHRLYIASELAQEAIKLFCSSHHWPLQSTRSTSNSDLKAPALSLLVPDVLVELDEAIQLQNIHKIFSEEPTIVESNDRKKRIVKKK